MERYITQRSKGSKKLNVQKKVTLKKMTPRDIDLLPPELVPHLLSYLPTSCLRHTIRLVNKTWTKHVDDLHHHLTGPLFQFRALILPCALNHLLLDMKRHPELDLALGKELANCWDGEQMDLIQQLVQSTLKPMDDDGWVVQASGFTCYYYNKNNHMTSWQMPDSWKNSLESTFGKFQDAKEGLVNQIIRAFFPLFYNEKCGTKCFQAVTSSLLDGDATNTNTMDILMESFVGLCCQLDCPDEVVVWKVMERVLSLDVKQRDWSAVFPSMKDAVRCNGLEEMESLFEMECEMAVDLFTCWSGMGLKRETLVWDHAFHVEETISILERVRNFMFYLAGRLPHNETLRTKIVMALKTMESMDNHNSGVIFKMLQAGPNHSNQFISADMVESPNLLLCVDFQTLAHNLIIFMEFVHANLLENVSLQESKKVLSRITYRLINYLTYCLVSQTDSTLRINCYEVLEQTLMYLVQLGDYSSSFFINMCLQSSAVHRLTKSSIQKQHDEAYKKLLTACLKASSSDNSFMQLKEHMKKRLSVAPSHPILGNL